MIRHPADEGVRYGPEWIVVRSTEGITEYWAPPGGGFSYRDQGDPEETFANVTVDFENDTLSRGHKLVHRAAMNWLIYGRTPRPKHCVVGDHACDILPRHGKRIVDAQSLTWRVSHEVSFTIDRRGVVTSFMHPLLDAQFWITETGVRVDGVHEADLHPVSTWLQTVTTLDAGLLVWKKRRAKELYMAADNRTLRPLREHGPLQCCHCGLIGNSFTQFIDHTNSCLPSMELRLQTILAKGDVISAEDAVGASPWPTAVPRSQ